MLPGMTISVKGTTGLIIAAVIIIAVLVSFPAYRAFFAISVGIGLDTGDVVAGHVGSRRRLEFTLIGVPVNNSAYLSKVRPAKVLMSETTRGALPSSLEVVAYELLQLKGSTDLQPIYQLQIAVTTPD